MNLELAIVLSCDETGCLVQPLNADQPLQTEFSAAVKDRIRIRRRQLVVVDQADQPPQLVWRWRQAEVLEVRQGRAVIGACGVAAEATIPPGLTLNVGDAVWTTHSETGKEILDRAVEGLPEHPEWFQAQLFPTIEEAYRSLPSD